ncbi:PLP-dependent aminotransferase family protein [Chitinophaga sp. Cy-1792]|uniref:MocR-like pyridoxine biosynthesis transcription factor PdxR n=1 Tax=Chitinophaga sp. Cy-1792 TaxID=2608339 RepID=UPI001420D79C|nr:PLP-dependent aminotransferase family protein [Chitinophaga sp. Cy-1792]NIG56034.1 PLP-dependent aminotransferase family protein [Chitinophaga sp. Cy-1792]
MLPYKTLILLDKNAPQAIYLQVANRIIALIREGNLQPGTYLPGSRIMADVLGLHRKTIVAAYEELVSQDWLMAIPRKGMMVATNLPEIKPRTFQPQHDAYGEEPGFGYKKIPVISLPSIKKSPKRLIINDGFPDIRLAPMDEWIKECRSVIGQPYHRKIMVTSPPFGNLNLRQEMVHYLAASRGLNIKTANIMVTRGAQMSIYLAASLVINKGDNVIVGTPNYFFADLAFEQLGANLLQVPVDENGLDIDAVEKLCATKKIKLLYIIPHHHHPTTVTLSAERRMKLLALIRKYKLAVIEDDYDYDFHYASAPILPLASADHGGNVIYVGSFTKSLGLSLRIGFMIAPARFIENAAAMRRLMDLGGDNLVEEALANMLANGTINRHLKKANKYYWERRDLAGQLLQEKLGKYTQFRLPTGGMAIWLSFNKKYPLPAIAARAAEQGLVMSDGSSYSHMSKPLNALRFGFASLHEKELHTVTDILAAVLKRRL